MAKDGAGALIGDFLLLGLIVLIVLIAINWLRGQQSAQQRIAAGNAGGASGGTGAAAPGGISAALMQAWTNLTKAATSGQALANLTRKPISLSWPVDVSFSSTSRIGPRSKSNPTTPFQSSRMAAVIIRPEL